jgi:ATP phosphoribosyltransferase-like protein
MNVPNDKIDAVGKILPVLRSLTVLPLAQEGWSSVHSVIDKDSWDVMDQLKEVGAEGILICPIEKWYYKKNNLILKPNNTYTRWNLEFKLNKHE